MESNLQNRYDFLFLFDVTDGNPNGDPDANNFPRIDAETGMGLVTDVCLKRKVRNYVQLVKSSERPFDIFIKENAILNRLISEAHKEISTNQEKKKIDKKESARSWMCRNYYDIRTFGAVMATGDNAGQVRGPIQLTFGRSIDPIFVSEHCITRVAVTTEDDAEKPGGMGNKYTVPYALFRTHGFVSAHLAAQTGFSKEDLNLFWESLKYMFDHDHSAARGLMCSRRLIVFKHSTPLGNISAHKLFDLVRIELKDESKPARSFSDYSIIVNKENLPQDVELIEMIY